jgi:hypothetical protein
MKSRPAQPVNKGECCHRLGWIRYQFDKNVIAGMPVLQVASHKGAEWRVDLRAVSRWIEKRKTEKAARRRRVQMCHVDGRPKPMARLAALSLSLLERLRARRPEPGERCQHCAGRVESGRPGWLAFANGTAAHVTREDRWHAVVARHKAASGASTTEALSDPTESMIRRELVP